MSGEGPSSVRWPNPMHTVRTVHAGAKYLLTNFDVFHLPPPKNQKNRFQPLRDATQHSDAEFVSTTSLQPRWRHKEMSRVMQVDTIERHMGICLAWEGKTTLEVTTYRKPAGSTLYLKINRVTQWNDGYATSTALYEPSLDDFQSTAKSEQWKVDVLRIVHREDDQAWWHVQERMRKDKLRDPFKLGWKVTERAGPLISRRSSTEGPTEGLRELGKISKRKIPWFDDGQARGEQQLVAKRKRKLPWVTDTPAPRRRKSGGSKAKGEKTKKPWAPGIDTLSGWFKSRGDFDPADEEADVAVKTEDERAAHRRRSPEDEA